MFAAVALALVLLLSCGPEGTLARDDEPNAKTSAATGASADGRTGDRTALEDTTAAASSGPEGRPNVILILADDLDGSVYKDSTLDSAWKPTGTSFNNALATTSSCCPSRASIFRGQYAHNTGLVSNLNEDPGGGARFFRKSGLEDDTLATLLQEGGYETWFGGKYLNGYDGAGGRQGYVPPGWDRWRAYVDKSVANTGGTVGRIKDNRTDWLSGEATRFIEGRRGSEGPFFMQVSAWDTHTPIAVPGRHRDAYPDARAPRPPSFDEADVSDKPSWMAGKRPLKPEEVDFFDQRHAARLRSALTLEDLSRSVISALKRTGQLEDTYVIFTSDNGYHMGIHRTRAAKWTPYMEAHEVPFVVRGPGVNRGESFDELVANIDIAPTVLDLASLPAPGWMDGRSFAPFLDGEVPDEWRSTLLIEGVGGTYFDRPAYSGVRRVDGVRDDVYVEYAGGEEEYYDLAKDPHQLRNSPEDAPPKLEEDLRALKGCSGDACRRADQSRRKSGP